MNDRCAGCGGPLPEASRFCPHCGLAGAAPETRVMPEQPTRPRRRGAADATRLVLARAGPWPTWRRVLPRVLALVGVLLVLAGLLAAAWRMGRSAAAHDPRALSPSGDTRRPVRP